MSCTNTASSINEITINCCNPPVIIVNNYYKHTSRFKKNLFHGTIHNVLLKISLQSTFLTYLTYKYFSAILKIKNYYIRRNFHFQKGIS